MIPDPHDMTRRIALLLLLAAVVVTEGSIISIQHE
jgi:hypothetical protein